MLPTSVVMADWRLAGWQGGKHQCGSCAVSHLNVNCEVSIMGEIAGRLAIPVR